MKFSSREDIDAPIEAVFAAVSDFDAFAHQAMRRGADVQRTDQLPAPAPGMTWDVAFTYRGKRRDLRLKLTEHEAPGHVRIDGRSSGLETILEIDLMALSRQRTRMAVSLDLKPRNLSARLLIQSLKLAKGTLNKRFKSRVSDHARTLEDRLRA